MKSRTRNDMSNSSCCLVTASTISQKTCSVARSRCLARVARIHPVKVRSQRSSPCAAQTSSSIGSSLSRLEEVFCRMRCDVVEGSVKVLVGDQLTQKESTVLVAHKQQAVVYRPGGVVGPVGCKSQNPG
uniref:(northern house mosquito) hypothetical protein n=1 Tax=Culex pipiens TaxID=7175 RepID=A0A8D8A858_CULPI